MSGYRDNTQKTVLLRLVKEIFLFEILDRWSLRSVGGLYWNNNKHNTRGYSFWPKRYNPKGINYIRPERKTKNNIFNRKRNGHNILSTQYRG